MPTLVWKACTTAGRTVTAAGQIATHSARGQCVKPVPSPATLQETKRPAPIRHRQTYTWRVRVRNGPQDRFPRVGTYSCCTSVAHSWHTLNSADVVGSALMSLLLHRMNHHAGCQCELGYSCTRLGVHVRPSSWAGNRGHLTSTLALPCLCAFPAFLAQSGRAFNSTVAISLTAWVLVPNLATGLKGRCLHVGWKDGAVTVDSYRRGVVLCLQVIRPMRSRAFRSFVQQEHR